LTGAIPLPAAAAEFSGMSYLDNGVIKIGINLDIGGAITHLATTTDCSPTSVIDPLQVDRCTR
jgi:hypothetical protein